MEQLEGLIFFIWFLSTATLLTAALVAWAISRIIIRLCFLIKTKLVMFFAKKEESDERS